MSALDRLNANVVMAKAATPNGAGSAARCQLDCSGIGSSPSSSAVAADSGGMKPPWSQMTNSAAKGRYQSPSALTKECLPGIGAYVNPDRGHNQAQPLCELDHYYL